MFGIGAKGVVDSAVGAYLIQNGIYYLLALLGCFPLLKKLEAKWQDSKIWQMGYTVCVLLAFLVSVSFIMNQAYNPFIYFNF